MAESDEPLLLRPGRLKWSAVSAGGILFVAGGGLMIVDGAPEGWAAAIFFGLVAVVGVLNLLPGHHISRSIARASR